MAAPTQAATRAAINAASSAQPQNRYKLRVRVFGFAADSPNFDAESFDEQAALAQAVSDQAAAADLSGRNGKAARSAAVLRRLAGPSVREKLG